MPEQEARLSALDERVSGQGRAINELTSSMQSGFRHLEQQIGNLANTMAASQKIQWPALSLALAFATVIGTLAYWPIKESQGKIESRLEDSVSAHVYESNRATWRSDYALDQQQIAREIDSVKAALIPRPELENRFTDMQRQVDELKRRP
jgi:uncharacterized coiled-coil protein SlyX